MYVTFSRLEPCTDSVEYRGMLRTPTQGMFQSSEQ